MSRWARAIERDGQTISSTTFIIVDRLKETENTKQAAEQAGAKIIQMSMQYWIKDLARKLSETYDVEYDLQSVPDDNLEEYLRDRLSKMRLQDFLAGVSTEVLVEEAEAEAEPCAEEEA
jgi:hypothetical protein